MAINCPLVPALYVVLSFLTIIECVLTLAIYITERRLRLRLPSPFVYSLAISIALLATISFSFNIKVLVNACTNTRSVEWCVILSIFFRYLHVVSCLSVSCLALYRYVYLCWPLHYPTFVTRRRCYYVTAACWMLPTALAVVPSVIDGKAPCADTGVTASFYATYVVMYGAGALTSFVAYLLVALEFRKKRQVLSPNSDMAKNDRVVKMRTERSALSVLALYTLLSLPHVIMLLVTRIRIGGTPRLNIDLASLLSRIHLLLFLPFYAWANEVFRAALVDRVKKTWRLVTRKE